MSNKDKKNKVGGHDFDKIMKNVTSDLVWEEYETDNGLVSYPFWKSAIASKGDTYDDFRKWFEMQKAAKMKDLTGIVKPKAEFDSDSTEKPTVTTDYKSTIENNLSKLKKVPELPEFKDNTGIVKPKADMGKQTKNSMPAATTMKTDLKDLTGAVEVKKADFGGKAKPKTDNDVSTPKDATVEDKTVQKPGKGDLTGIVEPKADMGKQTKVDVTDQPKPKKGDMEDLTGVVDPKSTFGGNAKPKIDFDFSKPMTPVILGWDEVIDQFNKIMPD